MQTKDTTDIYEAGLCRLQILLMFTRAWTVQTKDTTDIDWGGASAD